MNIDLLISSTQHDDILSGSGRLGGLPGRDRIQTTRLRDLRSSSIGAVELQAPALQRCSLDQSSQEHDGSNRPQGAVRPTVRLRVPCVDRSLTTWAGSPRSESPELVLVAEETCWNGRSTSSTLSRWRAHRIARRTVDRIVDQGRARFDTAAVPTLPILFRSRRERLACLLSSCSFRAKAIRPSAPTDLRHRQREPRTC